MKTANKTRKRRNSLEWRINTVSALPNILSAAVIFIYSVVATQIPRAQYLPALKYIIPMVLIMEFVFSPLLVHLLFSRYSRHLEEFYEREFSDDERLTLFEDMSRIPLWYAFLVFGFFVVGSVIFYCVYRILLHMQMSTAILSFLECLFGSYMSACVAFIYTRNMVTDDIHAIVRAGLPREEVYERKFYGRSIFSQTIIFLVVPIVAVTVFSVYIMVIGFLPAGADGLPPSPAVQQERMAIISLLTAVCQILLAILFNRAIIASNEKMTLALESMIEDGASSELIDTEIHDELSYNQFLTNEMIDYLRKMLAQAMRTGESIDASSMELVKVSSQTESTAVEQSTATGEIVSTMEEANKLAESVEKKIMQVSSVAEETARNVTSGLALIEANLAKMRDMRTANVETVSCIQEMNEKAGSIWDIISIINSIADNTKIIAFNAELEATSMREKGRNFKNVANEIRRLANGTGDSTKEIKEHIAAIQAATERLVVCTKNCAQKIDGGIALVHKLESSLSEINVSTQGNASSALEIRERISQETEAFKQIVVTLHQISGSVESFSQTTHTILDTAFTLQKNANELASITNLEYQEVSA